MKTRYIYDDISTNSFYYGTLFRQICRENQNTNFMFTGLFPENRKIYEIMWENMKQTDKAKKAI
jgi:hypothetical protein